MIAGELSGRQCAENQGEWGYANAAARDSRVIRPDPRPGPVGLHQIRPHGPRGTRRRWCPRRFGEPFGTESRKHSIKSHNAAPSEPDLPPLRQCEARAPDSDAPRANGYTTGSGGKIYLLRSRGRRSPPTAPAPRTFTSLVSRTCRLSTRHCLAWSKKQNSTRIRNGRRWLPWLPPLSRS